MKILVFNCGSSSLKYSLMEMPAETLLAAGEAQRVGPPTTEPARIVHNVAGRTSVERVAMPDHMTAFVEVMRLLDRDLGVLPDAIGHRMVHGGARFCRPTKVTDSLSTALADLQSLAPIHNPPALKLIEACRAHNPELPQVAVFDTEFHSTIPDHAYTYALPAALTQELNIRKYGFHGISHQYVASEAAKLLGRPIDKLNAVSCHLGSGGASLCAIVHGQSVDNTMGYSPLQGLVMSTRCGDLGAAVTLGLLARSVGDTKKVEDLLNRRSGVLGMSGISADIRDVLRRAPTDSADLDRAELTTQIYLWRIKKYLGSYLAVVGNAEAVIFTDTIGETIPRVRSSICSDMEAFGLSIDEELNETVSDLPADVSADHSEIRALVIHTNEELATARYTYGELTGPKQSARKGRTA